MTRSYLISVSFETGCYRHIHISASASLYQLHKVILSAFNFDDDHAHAFFMDNRIWSPGDAYFSMEMRGNERLTKKYTLKKLKLQKGDKFKYLFDFGEDWTFQCKVLRELEEPIDFPVVVRSVGEAPEQYGEPYPDGDSILDHPFPVIFEERFVQDLYDALPVPKEIVEEIRIYCEAAAHLYGIIPLRILMNLYNKHNPPITQEDFVRITEVMRHEANDFVILGAEALYADAPVVHPIDREIIAADILGMDPHIYYQFVEDQLEKPFVILPKEEFLLYAIEPFGPMTPQKSAMLQFLKKRKKRLYGGAEEILYSFLEMIWLDCRLQETVDGMEEMGFQFKSQDEMAEFAKLYQELNNHTRKISNCGHTPMELSEYRQRELEKKHAAQVVQGDPNQISLFGEDE